MKHSIILCTYAWAFIELRLLTSTSPQEPSFIVVPNTLLFRLLSARTPPCGAWIMLLSMGLSLSGFSFLSNPRPLASICCTESRTPFRWGTSPHTLSRKPRPHLYSQLPPYVGAGSVVGRADFWSRTPFLVKSPMPKSTFGPMRRILTSAILTPKTEL